ncbi:MAG: hypothetical protein AAF310_04090 [Myxococcota bacterium]
MIDRLFRFATKVCIWLEGFLLGDPYEKLDRFIQDAEEHLVTARVVLHFVAEQTFLTDDRAQYCQALFVLSHGTKIALQQEFYIEENLFFRQLCQLIALEEEIRSQARFLEQFKRKRKVLRHLYVLEKRLLRSGCPKSQLREILPDGCDACLEKILKMAVQFEKRVQELFALAEQSEQIAYAVYPDKPDSIIAKAKRRRDLEID